MVVGAHGRLTGCSSNPLFQLQLANQRARGRFKNAHLGAACGVHLASSHTLAQPPTTPPLQIGTGRESPPPLQLLGGQYIPESPQRLLTPAQLAYPAPSPSPALNPSVVRGLVLQAEIARERQAGGAGQAALASGAAAKAALSAARAAHGCALVGIGVAIASFSKLSPKSHASK